MNVNYIINESVDVILYGAQVLSSWMYGKYLSLSMKLMCHYIYFVLFVSRFSTYSRIYQLFGDFAINSEDLKFFCHMLGTYGHRARISYDSKGSIDLRFVFSDTGC